MDWIGLLTVFLTSGAFVTVYLVGDKKTSTILDNVSKSSQQWQELVRELREEKIVMEQKHEEKSNKIDSQWKEISVWRDKCDKLSSKIAYYRAFECRKIKCLDREPPFGSGAFMDENCATCKERKINQK